MRKWINLFEQSELDRELNEWHPPRGLQRPRPVDWEMFRKIRHACRAESGGGGYCHEVSEWIMWKYGWDREAGSYLAPNGDVAIAGHYWNVLPDGSILDCTADQTGEGHDMRLIPPTDPDYQRYDEEWYEDWHPDHPDYKPTMRHRSNLRGPFKGETDYDQQDRLSNERGHHWWSTHPDQLTDYLNQQIAYAEERQKKFPDEPWSHGDVARWKSWMPKKV